MIRPRQPRSATADLPPLSLYIHLPWCVSKCPYCDFNSYARSGSLDEERYIRALIADLECNLAYVAGRHLISIFIGGGTPSLFSAESIDKLLTEIRRRIPLANDCEITMEVNPDSTDVQRFEGFRKAGVNRLSLGIQSFSDAALRQLSRVHDGAAARLAITRVKQAGFDNFNLDLMFGLPRQTLGEALSDVHCAIDFNPSHISYYQLTLEPNTLFHKFPPPLPEHDEIFKFQEDAMFMLRRNGYSRYEVSAFGKIPCRHNLNYWNFGDYLGIGAGAHSKLSVSLPDKLMRSYKTREPKAYMERAYNGNCCAREWVVDRDSMVFEFLMNALRLSAGVEVAVFERHTGLPEEYLRERVSGLLEQGKLEHNAGYIKASDEWYWFLDQLLEECLPQSADLSRNMSPELMVYSQLGSARSKLV